MKVFSELVPIKNSCLGLGFFDGVHKGHSTLIKELVEQAKNTGKKSVILTFQKSPAEKFISEVKYLTTNEEKNKLLEMSGVDYVVELDFNDCLMKMSAEEYIKNVLFDYFEPEYIFSGFNHTFGANKAGNPDTLRLYQKKSGYKYIEIPPILLGDKIISSTSIREYLNKGDIELSNKMLGYNFSISGIVIEGNKLGRTMGFPTANIKYPEQKVQIPFGVYSVFTEIDGDIFKGVLNYGTKPTINLQQKEPVAEVHIIGFNENIYDKNIKISFIKKLRGEKKFDSVDELRQQIIEDLAKC